MVNNISSEEISSLMPFIYTLRHYEKHKGKKFLILVIKEVRIALENYFVDSSEKKTYKLIRLNYSGIPRLLKSAIHSVKTNKTGFRSFVLSFLTIGRTAIFKKSPDYSTIYSPMKGEIGIPTHIYFDFVSFLKNKLKIDKFVAPNFENYHFSVKSSPLGDNSMESLLVELASIPSDLRECIFKVGGKDLEFRMNFLSQNFRTIAEVLPGFQKCVDKLIRRFKSFKNFINPSDIFDIKDPFYGFLSQFIRKLVSFAEYEGKTRIIGLCDYWSQAALEPLATTFFKILHTLPTDQTFDQSDGCKELSFHGSRTYYSYDLTAFTDRFPFEIISNLLSTMFGAKYSNNVSYILCGSPF